MENTRPPATVELAGSQEPDFLNAVIVGEDRLFPPGYQVVRFTNNHDTNRVMSDVLNDPARAETAATLLLTLPGTPMIYYGEAFGMRGEKGDGTPYWDEYRREPMDWFSAEEGEGKTTWFRPGDRFNAPFDGISVEEQEGVAASLLDHYRALGISWSEESQRVLDAIDSEGRLRVETYDPSGITAPG